MHTEKDLILDIDSLLGHYTNRSHKKISSDVLPSLLMTFYETQNPQVQTRVMEVIIRLFDQRREFLHNLQKMEILFDDQSQQIYVFLKQQVSDLRYIGNQSELWISKFMKDPIEEC